MSFDESSGLIVSTVLGTRCKVPLSEMAVEGEQFDAARFIAGLIVKCWLVRKSRHGQIIMSLRYVTC